MLPSVPRSRWHGRSTADPGSPTRSCIAPHIGRTFERWAYLCDETGRRGLVSEQVPVVEVAADKLNRCEARGSARDLSLGDGALPRAGGSGAAGEYAVDGRRNCALRQGAQQL